ncbi:hypothetical protein AAG906_039344 [Vitis piasezkii]
MCHHRSLLLGTAQVQFTFRKHACVDSGNYSANSAFSTNLNIVLSSISANASRLDRFYNTAAGLSPDDRVYGIFLCRGDTKPYKSVPKPERGKDVCMVRYANRTISSNMEQRPSEFAESPTAIRSDSDGFNRILGDLMDRLVTRAVLGSPQDMFAIEEVKVTDFRNLFFKLINDNLSQHFCNVCFRNALDAIPTCYGGREGGRVLAPSCTIRYESGPFFETNGTTVTLSPPANSSSQPPTNPAIPPGKRSNISRIVLITTEVPIVIVLLIILIWFFVRRAQRENDEIISAESSQFNFSSITVATNNFSNGNKLGREGFGDVYKGVLSNGQEIAVKRLSKKTDQGEPEFKNEVLLLAKLQHRNLIRLLGFCLEGEERLLIYKRHRIIKGITCGLLYLHEDSHLRIIHSDLKASNILLDEDMNPKISDFGMARLFSMDEIHANESQIVGTYGYMAPEYICFDNGEELEHPVTYAWKHWNERMVVDIVDPILRTNLRNEIIRCLHIGLLCVQESVANRLAMTSIIVEHSSQMRISINFLVNEVSITDLHP